MVVGQGAMSGTRFLLAGLLFCASLAARAQPVVDVYWNPNDRADTVMDFGATLVGSPVQLTFTVVNSGTEAVGILPTDRLTYYALLDVPGAPQFPDWKLEFSPVILATPFVVPAKSQGNFTITYLAQDLPNLPEDQLAQAVLELKIVEMSRPGGPFESKTFLLKGIKTRRVVSSSSPHLSFDSVYVRPRPVPSRTYRIENLTPRSFPVTHQQLVPRSSVIDSLEFKVDTLTNAVIGPRDVLTWSVRYQPHNIGFDSAEFRVAYLPNENAAPDTIRTTMSGHGVEQKLSIVSVTSSVSDVPIRWAGDTVDFGRIDAGRTSNVDATVIVRNVGNIHMRLERERSIGRTSRDTASFPILRPLMGSPDAIRADIRTNEFDTLMVRFAPVDSGRFEIRYEVETDLQRRTISGVPDGAQFVNLVLTGTALLPRPVVVDTVLDFGSVPLLPDVCQSRSVRTIGIDNAGNADLTIEARIDPATPAVRVDPAIVTIPPGGREQIRVYYEPRAVGALDATVLLTTNGRTQPRIRLQGACRVPDTLHLSIPTNLRLRPGTLLRLPILGTADQIRLAQQGLIQLSYDPSILRYRSYANSGYATSGATIQIPSVDGQAGRLTVQMTQPEGSFIAADTIIVLEFETFLGRQAATDITFADQQVRFGSMDCPTALSVTYDHGRFAVDSICGLSNKLVQPRSTRIDIGVAPNPATDDAMVMMATGVNQDVLVTVLDTFGRTLCEPIKHHAQVGITAIPLPLATVPPGVNYVLVRGMHTSTMTAIVVQR